MKKKLGLFSKWCSLFFLCFVLTSGLGLCEDIEERFGPEHSLFYEVFFNGIPTGKIEWRYLGREVVDGRNAEVILLNSDTNILKLLNLESKEKVFIDSKTYLPLKVERDVVFFGKKELIKEVYNQDTGLITITKSNSGKKEVYLRQKKPIHNILSLLYFFPKNIDLVKNKLLYFNLPTQKITIKMLYEKDIAFGKGTKDIYFLSGRGDKKFNLWLDKRERIPVKMEFIVPLGKITIVRKS
ncbi:MAG: hypothetical protein M0R48_08040 [Candidatus Omnitrophica bacterium]|nr:hypothetical protein [Candidatus Omnitrophota bacterium]